ncbi:MAG: hypothetical protein Q9184_000295 [Pyrenodesmia sp. 2 TL-2023]
MLEAHKKARSHCYCHHCNQTFDTAGAFAEHDKIYHVYGCGHCKKTFPSPEGLATHQRAQQHCCCRYCDLLFISEKDLQTHLHTKHNHLCGRCLGRFTPVEELCDHHKEDRTPAQNRCLVSDLNNGPDSSYLKELERHFANLSLSSVGDSKCVASPGTATSPSLRKQNLGSGAPGSGLDGAEADRLFQYCNPEHTDALGIRIPSLTDTVVKNEISPVQSDRSKLSSFHTAMELGHGSSTERAPSEDLSVWISPFSSAQASPTKLAKVSASSPSQLTTTGLSSFACLQCPPYTRSFSTIKALHEHLSSHVPGSRILDYLSDLRMSNMKSRSGRNIEVLSKNLLATLRALKQNMDTSESGEKPEGIVEFVEEQLGELGFEGLKLLA